MRLRLTLLAWAGSLLVVLAAGSALAGGEAGTRLDVYTDPWITVFFPSFRGAWEGEDVTVDGTYSVNAISGATYAITADAVSSATTWKETRHQVDASVGVHPEEHWSLGTFILTSREPDYVTNAGGVTGSVDLFQRMVTARATYGLSLERLGSSADPGLDEQTVAHQLDLGWTQILGRTTTARVLLTGSTRRCGPEFGCLASPYRYVGVVDPSGLLLTMPERNPDALLRGAAALRVSQSLGRSWAVHAGYRFYGDSWRVAGHAVDLSLATSLLDDQLTLWGDARLGAQGAASFYRDTYDSGNGELLVPEFRTSDRELSGLSDRMLGGRARWVFYNAGPASELGLTSRVSRSWYTYPYHGELPARAAWLVGGGLDAEF